MILTEAANCFCILANMYNVDAMMRFAQMLYEGDGIPVDKKRAALYFKMAADFKNVDAMMKYAQMLIKGDGIDKNQKEAEIYLNKIKDYSNSANNDGKK
ncbi:hypothetical protein M9Y10_045569 [Tritrichomonas musculus]|uniref:Beta-lactamase n=1 Tax=Tritrichomonas musculus TaxID=1915356 RepID=A0ABR2JVS3_9EUKA